MQKLCAVFLLTLSLSACVTEPSGPLFGDRDLEEAPELAPSKEGLRDSTPFCELKGPVNARKCMDGSGETGNTPGMQSSETASEKVPAGLSNAERRDIVDRCNDRVKRLTQKDLEMFFKLYERDPDRAYFHCANLAKEVAAPKPAQSIPDSGSGGGCEYQGQNYSPGDEIYAPIDSSSLFVFGKRFDSLAGKSGPWQMCECQVSRGHWGCV